MSQFCGIMMTIMYGNLEHCSSSRLFRRAVRVDKEAACTKCRSFRTGNPLRICPLFKTKCPKLCTDSLAFRDNRKSRGDCAWEVPLLFHYRWKKGHNPCSSPSTACFRKLPLLLLPRWHTGYLHNLAESLMPARLQQPWPPLGDHRKASLRG